MDQTIPPTSPQPEPQQVVPTPQPVVPEPAPVPVDPVKDVADNKDIAAVSYVWILSIFVYLYKRESPFIRFHAKQGIVLFGASIVAAIVPSFFGRILQVLVLVACLAGFMFAAQGKWKKLPLIYAISCGDMKALRQSWKDSLDFLIKLWHKAFHRTETATATPAEPSSPAPTEQTPL